jgi:hypothetical protein
MKAAAAAALVGASPAARARQKIIWDGKKLVKNAFSPLWDKFRRHVFSARQY